MDVFFSFRSYNEQLFPQAAEVLERIRHAPERIDAFVKLGEHIKVKPMVEDRSILSIVLGSCSTTERR